MRHRIAAVRVLPLSARASGTSVAVPFVAGRPNLLSYLRRPCLRVARAAVESRLFFVFRCAAGVFGVLLDSRGARGEASGAREGARRGGGFTHGELVSSCGR